MCALQVVAWLRQRLKSTGFIRYYIIASQAPFEGTTFEKISRNFDFLGFDASLENALFSNFIAYTVLVPTLDLEIAHICF